MATHSSILAWRIPGMGEPGGLLSLWSHRVGHDWSDLAAAAAAAASDKAKVKFPQSCPTLCNPMDYILHGIFQARILEWVPFPSPGDPPNPEIRPRSPVLQADSLPAEPPGTLYLLIVTVNPWHYSSLCFQPLTVSSSSLSVSLSSCKDTSHIRWGYPPSWSHLDLIGWIVLPPAKDTVAPLSSVFTSKVSVTRGQLWS